MGYTRQRRSHGRDVEERLETCAGESQDKSSQSPSTFGILVGAGSYSCDFWARLQSFRLEIHDSWLKTGHICIITGDGAVCILTDWIPQQSYLV